jgi:hypothetical protein
MLPDAAVVKIARFLFLSGYTLTWEKRVSQAVDMPWPIIMPVIFKI